MISRILTVAGLLITVLGNLATFNGVHTAVNGMMTAESSGIASVATGMSSAYSWSLISLVGCFILVVGLLLSAFKPKARVAAV
jgi:uncharacterized membrane protein